MFVKNKGRDVYFANIFSFRRDMIRVVCVKKEYTDIAIAKAV